MFFHYFKLAYRVLIKNNIYSLISIIGLSIALSLAFIISGDILFQLSFDKNHQNHKKIYRVLSVDQESNQRKDANSPYLLASVLKDNFPEVKETARIVNVPFNLGFVRIINEYESIEELDFYSADQEIFSILDILLISKTADKALADPSNIILSESAALKYFDRENPLGKTMLVRIYGKSFELKVTGIFKDFPENSSIKADFFCTTDLYIEVIRQYYSDLTKITDVWDEELFVTLVLFKDHTNVGELESKLNKVVQSFYNVKNTHYEFQNLADLHFFSLDIKNDLYFLKGNIQQVYLFVGIIIVILLIAVINYIILTTARSTLRYKELGLKKVFGINKTHLVVQLMIESLTVSLISFIISLIILLFIKDYLHLFLFNDLDFSLLWNWKIFFVSFAITIVTGIFSGLYLAFHAGTFNPIDTLKNKISIHERKFDFKVILIIFQLIAFIILTTYSLFIYKQVQFAMNSDLGFRKEDLIIVRFDPKEFLEYQVYKNAIKQNPNIISVSGAYFIPPANASSPVKYARIDDPSVEVILENYNVDYDFFKTLGIEIIEGREFDASNTADLTSGNILINKKAVKEFGLKNPIGKKIGDRRIIGVADNFYVHSFHLDLLPAIYSLNPYSCIHVAVKTSPGQTDPVIDFLNKQWINIAPNIPFDYYFVDNELKQFYKKDIQFGNSMRIYSMIAIFISIMGMFGLALFISERKTKEIGIRKVHGASELDIIYLLTKKFFKYALIANLIAIPITYYLVENWLQNFSFRLSVIENWWVFIVVGVFSIFIIISTIGYKAWQTSKLNPVGTLKYE